MTAPRFIFGFFLLLLGIAALIGISIIKFVIAIVLIIFGIRILAGWKTYPRSAPLSSTSDEILNEVVILSPFNKSFTSSHFEGGKLVLIFAGGELDLTKADTESAQIQLEVVAIFSGLKIKLPKHWRVRTRGVAIVGGYDTQHAEADPDARVTLDLTGAAIFGGVEVTQ